MGETDTEKLADFIMVVKAGRKSDQAGKRN